MQSSEVTTLTSHIIIWETNGFFASISVDGMNTSKPNFC